MAGTSPVAPTARRRKVEELIVPGFISSPKLTATGVSTSRPVAPGAGDLLAIVGAKGSAMAWYEAVTESSSGVWPATVLARPAWYCR